jgi:ribosomal protein L12E/L44/L45/RPP1/RPP2
VTRIEPDQPISPKTPRSDEPEGQPKKRFPKIKGRDEKEGRGTAEAKKEAERKAEEKKKQGLAAFFGGPAGKMAAGVQEETVATGLGSNVDRLVQLFQDPANSFFTSAVQTVGVAQEGGEIKVSVMLESGVSIDINLGQGGEDLNVVITGISADMQAAIDNLANQEQLRTQLLESGFRIHQITTVRGDQPVTAGVTQAKMQAQPAPETPEGRTRDEGEREEERPEDQG